MLTGPIGTHFRRCYKLIEIPFQELKKEDLFMLIDSDGPVRSSDGNTIFKADSDAVPSEGVYGVKVNATYHLGDSH